MRFSAITLLMLLLVLALAVGLCLLQYRLSRMRARWPGLVLPVFSFLGSLTLLLNAAAPGGVLDTLALVLGILTRGNVMTAVFLIIYAVCRGKARRRRELERMQIQEL